MASTINVSLQTLITQQALASGVPPSIALAVAQKESSVSQWNSDGSLVTGTSGEVGVFQLMPKTAAAYAPDGTGADVNANIAGGISLLAALYQKYGDWTKALSAYNSGSPTGAPSYANSVLATAASVGSIVSPVAADVTVEDTTGTASAMSTPVVVGLILGGIALAWWALD
jgi:soluble lytic murein transglycosylase-like protein